MAQEILRKKARLGIPGGQAPIALPSWLPTATLVLMPIAACWQVWLWSFNRLTDRSDDPYGLFALLAATAFSLIAAKQQSRSPANHQIDWMQAGLIGASLGAYVLTVDSLPMLIRSGFAISAVALLISRVIFGMRINLAILGLCLLSLPVVATMQFYMGFPLRLLVTRAVSAIVNIGGYSVNQSGTDLIWARHVVGIDPSCSGVKMLWTGFFAALALSCLHKMSNTRTLLLCFGTLAVVLCGNIIRATALFLMEVLTERSQFVPPEWLHSAVGVAVFAFILLAVAVLANFMARKAHNEPQAPLGEGNQSCADFESVQLRRSRSSYYATGAFALVCLITTITSFTYAKAVTPAIDQSKIIYVTPSSIDGTEVREIPLTVTEQAFTEAFPGIIHKMTDGRRQFILRDVMQATRQLHPAEDCFKGSGYKTHSKPNLRDTHGTAWGQFEASTGDLTLIVRERIYDDHGQSWTDVSSWYWAALFGKTKAPWHALTIASPL